MLELALHYKKKQVLLREIASSQGISEKYLWHLIALLKNAGLINSTRGTQGGYELAKSPRAITLKEIISALEGPLDLIENDDLSFSSSDVISEVTMEIWQEVSKEFKKVLYSITLEGMIEKQKQKSNILEFVI